MIEPQQLLDWVISPTLDAIELGGEPARRLVFGTACQESWLRYLHQIGGPALGLWQMEPATHDDLKRWLATRPNLESKVQRLARRYNAEEMIGNLYYGCAMCRIKYRRDADPIPATLPEQAAYWKRVYNTPLGSGSVQDYISNWQRFAGGVRF